MNDKKKKLRKLDKVKVLTSNSVIWFGKWKNQRLEYIIETDPGWVVWACDQGIILLDNNTYMATQRNLEMLNDNTPNYRED